MEGNKHYTSIFETWMIVSWINVSQGTILTNFPVQHSYARRVCAALSVWGEVTEAFSR